MLKRFTKLNNKAFSLLEILLAVSLLAVVALAIGSIIINTQNNTAQMLNESELQQQSAEAQETLHNEILATNTGIKYWIKKDDNPNYQPTLKDEGNEQEKIIAFYNTELGNLVLTKTYYKYDAENKTLMVASLQQDLERDQKEIDVDNNLASTLTTITKWTMVASNVDSFRFDLTNYDNDKAQGNQKGSKLITYSLTIKQDDVSYPIEDTVYLRNDIIINGIMKIDVHKTSYIDKPKLLDNELTYNGNLQSPVEKGYMPRLMNRMVNGTPSPNKPSARDANTYVVVYSLKDKNNMRWSDGTTADVILSWTIHPLGVSVEWIENRWTYDGTEKHAKYKIHGVLDGDTCDLIFNNNFGPDATPMMSESRELALSNKNYKLIGPNYAYFHIEPACPDDLITVTLKNDTYTGENLYLASHDASSDFIVRFYISTNPNGDIAWRGYGDTDWHEKFPVVNAGTYYVYYSIESFSLNYYDGELGGCYAGKIEVYRKPIRQPGTSSTGYTGNQWCGVTNTDGVILGGEHTKTNAGRYTATVIPDQNHIWMDGTDSVKNLTWYIFQVNSKFQQTPKPNDNLEYNAEPLPLLSSGGQTKDGLVYYALTDTQTTTAPSTGAFSSTIPTATAAGSYRVWYYIQGDANHYNSTPQHVDVEIKKAGNSIKTDPTAKQGLVYSSLSSSQNQVLIQSGTAQYGIIMYAVVPYGAEAPLTTSYSPSTPKAKDAGKYTVYYYATGDTNHVPTEPKSIDVEIKRNPSATAHGFILGYSGKQMNGVSGSNVKWVTEEPTQKQYATNPGKYGIMAYPTSNYAWEDGGIDGRLIEWEIVDYTDSNEYIFTAGSTATLITGAYYYETAEDAIDRINPKNQLPVDSSFSIVVTIYDSNGNKVDINSISANDADKYAIYAMLVQNKQSGSGQFVLGYFNVKDLMPWP